MTKRTLVYSLVLAWLAVFVGSFLYSAGLEGPRNIDTGFRRLDRLIGGQAIALALAVLSGGIALTLPPGNRRAKLAGFVPAGLTLGLVVAAAAVIFVVPGPAGDQDMPTLKPTAPVAEPGPGTE